ncbi:MAG TPA: DUF192 domain-containing protein [Terriglobales bacterium]|nr:DUF192 domain-containing protein [Terriglobales bacterium]
MSSRVGVDLAGAPALATALMLFVMSFACQGQPRVVIRTQEGREIGYVVEIADTPAKRELGLQYRRELAENHGMLFLFPAEKENVFWMKNTPIPLDMIFINANHQIVGIVENAVPFTTEGRSVPAPSQFVLEINGGRARRQGFEVGDRVRFENIPATAE